MVFRVKRQPFKESATKSGLAYTWPKLLKRSVVNVILLSASHVPKKKKRPNSKSRELPMAKYPSGSHDSTP